MNQAAQTSNPRERSLVLLIVLGILFMALWIAAHVVWASMALIGTAMANDSGEATSDQHANLIVGMLVGQILAGAAGIPGGLAFFWRGMRKWLWIAFAILFVGGAVCQYSSFTSFVQSVKVRSS